LYRKEKQEMTKSILNLSIKSFSEQTSIQSHWKHTFYVQHEF